MLDVIQSLRSLFSKRPIPVEGLENNNTDENFLYIKPELVEAILKTINFYDLFDYPLTLDEIQDYLYKYPEPLHARELRATLEYLIEEGKVASLKDYYVLAGREKLIEIRKTRKFIAERFWNRVKLYGQYMRAVPFVKMIAVCNNLSYDNPSEQSDIDLFIVIKPGRMWLARLAITLILQFYGVRRYGNNIAGRFCLSFFVTENKLSVEEFELKPEDPYLAYWVKNLTPVYGEKAYEEFKLRNTLWLNKYGLEFTENQKRHMYLYKERKTKRFAEWVFRGWMGNFCEWVLKMTFKRKTLKKAAELGNQSHVVVTDDMLKFHSHDKRSEYYERWKNSLTKEV